MSLCGYLTGMSQATTAGSRPSGHCVASANINVSQSVRTSEDRKLRQSALLLVDRFNIAYHLRTIYLFTASDFKTIVIPKTLFGILGALSSSMVSRPVTGIEALGRMPLVFCWVYFNLLPLNILNQSRPGSVDEDALNKPWRPLPSRRLSLAQARPLMLGCYALAIVLSLRLRALGPCLALIVFGSLYNEFGGADRSLVTRNALNAAGYLSFIAGAVQVAASGSALGATLTPAARWWLLGLGLVVFATMHVQDFCDQAGDAARGRRTLPLTLGDRRARAWVAGAVGLCSAVVPAYWRPPVLLSMLPQALALAVITELAKGSVASPRRDRRTFLLWNVWITSLYALPFLKDTLFG